MENQIAGVHTIRLALTHISKAKIIVYIGNIQNTMQHLRNHEIHQDIVYVTNSGSELLKSLKQCISGKEKLDQKVKEIDKKAEALIAGNNKNGDGNHKKIEVTLTKKS